MNRRDLLGCGLGGLAAAASRAAHADDQPVRIVVPFAPGGSTDVLARRLAEKLRVSLDRSVLVDNRGGAGGTIGAAYVAKSAPDGSTLLLGVTGTNGIAPSIFAKLPYDSIQGFEPVSLMVTAPLVLVTKSGTDVKSVADYIATAKRAPDTVTYGTPGVGTSMHLTGVMFDLATGTRLVHVPYRGSALALTDLMGGRIDSMFGDLLVVLPQVNDGTIRALAVTSKTRNPLLPDVPTLEEAGLSGFEALSWQGLFAPAKTPRDIVDRLSRETRAAMQDPEVRSFFAKLGFAVDGSTPDLFRDFVTAEIEKWRQVVRAGKIELQ